MGSPLERFLPDLLRQRLLVDVAPIHEPVHEGLAASALFCDISGFTPLTESLVQQGPEGVERLSEILNRYFGELIGLVQGHGGDVVKFAGDALLALWQPPGGEAGLGDATCRAVQCGLEIQERLGGFDSGVGVKLTQRVAIGSGTVRSAHVGGALGRWEFVVAGEPLRQLPLAMKVAEPGQVGVAQEAWTLCGGVFRGSPADGGGARVDRVTTPLPLRPLEPVALPGTAEDALRMYIPGTVLARVDAGQSWTLGELRLVSIVFVHFPTLTFEPNDIDVAQEAIRETQNAVYRWEGNVNKVAVDDKGASMLAALGLPPLSHEDDPVRAVRAALDLHRRLTERSIACSVGVTTGKVYCGVVGNDSRCEYTMHGDVVNLAARLMQAAAGRSLVDEPTFRASTRQLDYATLAPMDLKGKEKPVAVFQPTGRGRQRVLAQTELVGRGEELTSLSDLLQGTVRAHESAIGILRGEAGIGKSRLVAGFIETAEQVGVRWLLAEGRAIARSTAYAAWRSVLQPVLGIDPADAAGEQEAKALAWLAADAELEPLAPLLNAVLPIDLADNEITGQMREQVRADNINALLVRILRRHMGAEPLVLVVEDAHWLDSSSWSLLAAVCRELHPVFVLVVTRPLPPPEPAEYSELASRSETRTVELGQLAPAETLQVVCQRLGVARLAKDIGDLINDKAEGNPFFAEEIAYALRDGGQLVVDGDKARLAADAATDLSKLELPDTVQGVIVSRVDRLEPREQLLLKVASVIGREFLPEVLTEVFPAEAGRGGVQEALQRLVELDIVRQEAPEPDARYAFMHALGQEAVYGLMLFEQRRDLHGAVAGWYERNYCSDLTPYYPLLAHHWSRAEEQDKALEYLQKAGDQARARSANREAVRFYEDALERLPSDASTDRRLGISEGLATSCHAIGELDASRLHCRTALRLLGWGVPGNPVTLVLGLWWQIGVRVLQAKLPGRFVERSLERRSRRLQAVKLHNHLTEIHGFRAENVAFLYSSLREVNLGHPAGPSLELGRALAMMSVVLGTIPLHGACAGLLGRAVEIAGGLSRLARAVVLSRCAIYPLYIARWKELEARTDEVLETTSRYPNRRLQEEAGAIRGWGLYAQGRLAEAEDLWKRVLGWARASYNDQAKAWAQITLGLIQARLGRADEGLDLYEQAGAYIDQAGTSEQITARGGSALVHLLAGRREEARRIADEVLDVLDGTRPMAYFAYQSVQSLPEVYFGLLDDAGEGAERSALLGQCRRACKALDAFAKVFPFGGAAALYWRSRLQRAQGDAAGARSTLESCLARADELSTSYEHDLAEQDLAERT